MRGDTRATVSAKASRGAWAWGLGLFVPAALLMWNSGCQSESSRPDTAAERSQRALQDPFNYSPFEKEKSPVSGGGIRELDREGLKKDTNNVFNP